MGMNIYHLSLLMLNCTQQSNYFIEDIKMFNFFCLKTQSCLCRVRDTNKLLTKNGNICWSKVESPIKILFPYRYNSKF